MTIKQTLQLRHQLSCSGITVQAATYDATRHHVLAYDSSALASHTLRLFSLRREIKSIKLFDEANLAPVPPQQTTGSAVDTKNKNNSSTKDAVLVPIVHALSLEYSQTMDVYICVYTAQSVPLSRAKSKCSLSDHEESQAVYNVLILEPASLKKLVSYPGPISHRLRCVFYDDSSDKLVLAVHRKSSDSSCSNSIKNSGVFTVKSRQPQSEFTSSNESFGELENDETCDAEEAERVALAEGGPMYNHIDILQISKREFKASWRTFQSTNGSVEVKDEETTEHTQRTMLCIEKTKSSLLHSETISLVCGSKRLMRLFGVGYVSVGGASSAGVVSFLVEWRESAEQRLELIRRVMLHDIITAITLSSCSTWLFTGHESGALRVWNVSIASGSKERVRSYSLGASPLESKLSAWHGHPVSSLRLSVITASAAAESEDRDQHPPTEAMVITADRDSGVVKHWRFQAGYQQQSSPSESKAESASSSDLVAKIDLVGSYNCDFQQVSGTQSKTAAKKRTLLDSALCTVPIFVNIDMGGFTENLVLILRDDVIHVLKVQTVMHVLQESRSGDEISTFRIAGHPSTPKLVVLSGNQFSSVRILALGARYQRTGEVQYLNQLIPPASQRSTSISAIECYRTNQERSFVVFGWSCGSVDVHSLDTRNRVGILQDPHLNTHITALGVVMHVGSQEPRALSQKAKASSSEPTRSWGGLLKSSAPKLDSDASETASNTSRVDTQHHKPTTVFIFAGTENGQIFGWKVPAAFDASAPSGSGRLLLESNIRVDSAHSAHVVQFARLRQQQRNDVERLVSLGADGMVKVWEVPSLSIVGYVNTATEGHLSMPSCMCIVNSEDGGEPKFLAVGFEDGMLAVWKLDSHKMLFAELQVASHHERRVTSIAASKRSLSATQSGSGHVIEFLSCSLDMTAIIWSIREDCVDEKRYFDIGAPVVDICTVENVAVAALANEICTFEYCLGAPSSRTESSSRSDSEQIGDTGVQLSTAEEHQRYHQSPRPNTPTTHSDGEVENEDPSPTETAERVVNVLRVPTSLPQPEAAITIPSALTTSSKFTTKPVATGAALDRTPDAVVRNRKKTGRQEVVKIHGDELCAMLQEYIECHGTNGTMPAEYLTHFLANHRLAIIKRPDFAIRKYFQRQKMDLKTRLSVYDACEVLLAIQGTPETRKGKFDKQQHGSESQARQKQVQKPMANRKAVVSFNILGEKSIRWEVCDPVKEIEPTKRKEPSRGDVQSREPTPASKSPTSASIRVPTDQSMSPPKESAASTPENEDETTVSTVFTRLDDDDSPSVRQLSRKRRNRKLSVAESMKSEAPKVLPDHDLIHRLKLSRCFRQRWSRGYCWCSPCSALRVIWSEVPADESAKCSDCNKKIHSLALKRQGYKPHFSLRMVLGVIVEVYNELMIPSHSLLFKSAYKDAKDLYTSEAFSIHSTLYRVFTNKFGVQKVVEDKIKLFLVSATHYIRESDAIAVFGELLAMFARDDSSSDTHVPNEMVALCVSCYSWFFSRAMVINGDLIIGSGHDPGSNSQDTAMEIENGKRTHWQFVNLQNALLCAQEMLMYPLVSPGYLRNIVMYTGEYAQAYPTKPQSAGDINEYGTDTSNSRQATQWIEVHRFLRLLVGEWKQQHSELRVAEQTLFAQPLMPATQSSSTDLRAEVIEKLRLILSCFIFYDHEREGVMAIEDFTSILRKLRYLWPNENVTAEEAEAIAAGEVSLTFENTILAARRRFADVEGDGLICYLDFWAMLYIVGVKTLTLLKFREIPSFCRDYKLEISVDLHELLLCYMQRSSTMMLPRGFQLGKSSLDQRATIQHQRRVGGLHDGMFRMPNALGNSLSLQELLNTEKHVDSKDQIYLEGSAPALGQSASMSAMDRFRPVTRDSSDSRGQQTIGVAPVVVGVRHTGPREKPRAFLSVSAIFNDTLPDDDIRGQRSSNMGPMMQREGPLKSGTSGAMNPMDDTKSAFSNTYIQFPFVSPQQSRFEISSKQTAAAEHRIVGPLSSAVDDGGDGVAYSWQSQILKEHEDEERANAVQPHPVAQHTNELEPATQQAKHSPPRSVLHRSDASKTRRSSRVVTTAALKANVELIGAHPKPASSAAPLVVEPVKRKKSATIVVIPKIEKDTVKPTVLVASGLPSESLKHRYPAHEKLKAAENVVVETKAATVTEPTPDKPLTPEPWESVTNNLDEGASDKDEPAPSEQTTAVVADPSPRVEEVTAQPVPVVGVFDKTQVPTSDEAADADEAANSSEEAVVGGGGDDSSDEEADDENVEEQEETDNEETQDGLSETTPREVSSSLDADSTVTVQEFVTEVEPQDVTPDPAISTPPVAAVEIYISQPQKPPDALEDAQPSISTPLVLESPANETPFQSRSRMDDDPPHRQSLGAAVAVEVFQENTYDEPVKTSDAQQTTVEVDKVPPSRESNLASHHSFRFSQQPAFRSNAPVLNNPFRLGQWNPSNDSDSDEERRANEAAAAIGGRGFEEEDDGERPGDIELQLTPEALEAYRATFRPHLRRSGVNATLRPSLHHFGLAAAAANQLSNAPYKRSASRDSTNPDISRRNTRGLVAAARNSGTDRALYGEQDPSNLGEGIVLSAEAEVQMQQKWLAFFNNAEAAMFSPLKHEIQGREEAQRLQEELQSQLIKKRQDQQAQDTLRLQQSRRESVVLKTATGAGSTDKVQSSTAADSANFRLRRMARESCQEIQNELQFGVSAQGEFTKAHEAQFFFFEYDSNAHGSILTLRLNVQRGEAEVFMSTETKVPCVSDFMWRSVEKCKELKEGDGQKLVLYAHDLAKVVASANADSARDRLASDGLVIPFFISVVAVEPGTSFALSIMASGQKMEPSRAIKMVDTLIEQFNELSKSFEDHKASSFDVASLVTSSPVKKAQPLQDRRGSEKSVSMMLHSDVVEDGSASVHRAGGFLNHIELRRKQSALFGQGSNDNSNEYSGIMNQGSDNDGRESNSDGAGSDESEPEVGDLREGCRSFQHLLESIGEKRGFGAPKSKSFFLTGPTNDQFEFIQDEETNLLEAASQYSPERLSKPTVSMSAGVVGSSVQDAIDAVLGEKRLSMNSVLLKHHARRVSLRKRVAQRLSPLKAASGVASNPRLPTGSTPSVTTLRVAKFAPKPVAYSLSSLDHDAHHLHPSKSSVTLQPPPRRANLPHVHSTSSLR